MIFQWSPWPVCHFWRLLMVMLRSLGPSVWWLGLHFAHPNRPKPSPPLGPWVSLPPKHQPPWTSLHRQKWLARPAPAPRETVARHAMARLHVKSCETHPRKWPVFQPIPTVCWNLSKQYVDWCQASAPFPHGLAAVNPYHCTLQCRNSWRRSDMNHMKPAYIGRKMFLGTIHLPAPRVTNASSLPSERTKAMHPDGHAAPCKAVVGRATFTGKTLSSNLHFSGFGSLYIIMRISCYTWFLQLMPHHCLDMSRESLASFWGA